MAQIEVFDYLRNQRKSGNEKFFSAPEIKKELGLSKCVWGALVQLERFDYLEVQKAGRLTDFRRVYRVKEKFL